MKEHTWENMAPKLLHQKLDLKVRHKKGFVCVRGGSSAHMYSAACFTLPKRCDYIAGQLPIKAGW